MKHRRGSFGQLEEALERLHIPTDRTENYPEFQKTRGIYKKGFAANSTFVTTTHFFKSLFAPTILASPAAFLNGGIIFSAVAFLSILFLIGYNIRRLIISADHLSKRENLLVRTYDEVAYVSFAGCSERTKGYASAFRMVINILFFITNLDSCIIFMIFIGRNVEALVAYHSPDTFLEVRYFLFFQVILMMSMSSIRHLKHLTPFSFIAGLLLLGSVLIAVFYFFIYDLGPFSERSYIGSVQKIIRFSCIVLFCMSGISIALTLKSSMTNPEHFFSFPGVYYFSLVIIAIVYVCFGMLGYLKYGENTEASVMLNIPQGSVMSVVVKCLAIASVLLTSPLVFYVAFNVIWNTYLKQVFASSNVVFSEYFVRYCLIILSYLMATAFPDLNSMIVLKGALFHSHLEVTIPAILDYVTFYPDEGTGKFHIRLFRTIVMILCGTFFCVGGIVVSILDWIKLKGIQEL